MANIRNRLANINRSGVQNLFLENLFRTAEKSAFSQA